MKKVYYCHQLLSNQTIWAGDKKLKAKEIVEKIPPIQI